MPNELVSQQIAMTVCNGLGLLRVLTSVAVLAGAMLLSACAPGSEPADQGGTLLPSTQPNFAAPIGFAVGLQPNAIVSADFNADGKLDVAAANGGGNSVSVLLNTTTSGAATPTFRAQAAFPTGALPYGLGTGDVNGDGKMDLVAANSSDGTVSVLVNTMAPGATTPTFAPQMSFPVGGTVQAIALGDLNGDGKLDVAIAHFSGQISVVLNTVSVLLNTTVAGGPVTFASPVSFDAGFGVASVAIGDFNGDGKRDLVAVNLNVSAGAVTVLLNTAAAGALVPSFSPPTQFPKTFSPAGLALGDLNGDGKVDILTYSWALAAGLEVLFNSTNPGSMTPTVSGGERLHSSNYPESLALADRNGDGALDIFVAGADSSSSFIGATDNFLKGGDPLGRRWDGPFEFNAGRELAQLCTSVMTVGDFNGDGRLDVAVTDLLASRVRVAMGIPNPL